LSDFAIDYVMTANLVTIAVCLLLTFVWLILRITDALFRLWVAWTPDPAASTHTVAVGSLADEQQIPPTVVDARRAEAGDRVLAGENTVGVDKGSAKQLPTTFVAKSDNCQRGSALPPASTRAACPAAPRRRERNRSAPPRKRAAKVRLNPPSSDVRTQRMTADEIRRLVTAFQCWMTDRRLTGRQIAVGDVWAEALDFARAKHISLPKRDRFLEILAKAPGVTRRHDVRLDGETKTTVYKISGRIHEPVRFNCPKAELTVISRAVFRAEPQ
jgi:hypothetical protein